MADITDIRAVIYTEKTQANEGNIVVLKTTPKVTKMQLKAIFKEYFGIEPLKINSLNQSGKVKKFKGHSGKRDDFKKFYVKMPEGANIESLTV